MIVLAHPAPSPRPAFASAARERNVLTVSCNSGARDVGTSSSSPSRRAALLSTLTLLTATSAPISAPLPAAAVQGLTAGRIPGLSAPDKDGFMRYTRPEGKSGGHGVGWSEIPRYTFKVPQGWDEKPVSIADLGGTEIDLRFENPDQGSLLVVVAPVLRFMDVGYNADVKIEDIAKPDAIIAGFAPELYGKPLDAEDVIETEVVQDAGLTYYQWCVKPHHLVSATAEGNRLFILSTTSSSRQWRKGAEDLRKIQQSFRVPPKTR